MSNYPIESSDTTGIIDGLNYVLSGPSGLGQDFNGYAQWTPGYLTGNFRTPYTQISYNAVCSGISGTTTITVVPSFDVGVLMVGMTVTGYGIAANTTIVSIGITDLTLGTDIVVSNALTDDVSNDITFEPNPVPQIWVPSINLTNSTLLDPYTFKFEFATPYPTEPPFAPGNNISVSGVTIPGLNGVSSFTKSGTKASSTQQIKYLNISPSTVTGSGAGAVVTVTLQASGSTAYSSTNTAISVTTIGAGYAVGDTLKILGTQLGGATPANDLTLTVDSIQTVYDGDYSPIGVVECTTTYVIAKTSAPYSAPGTGTGGSVTIYWTSDAPKVYALSTDCNSKITVTGGTDRVFISAQLTNTFSYDNITSSADLSYGVAINRYRGEPNSDPVNPGYVFNLDKLVSKKVYTYTGLTAPGSITEDTIFSTFVDADIPPGYYWYILDVSFQRTNNDTLEVKQCEFGLRSMTTQVVKQ